MRESAASFREDGSCRLLDEGGGTDASWASLEDWAAARFTEWRSRQSGSASAFIQAACGDGVDGVVDAVVVSAEAAGGDPELLSWVGAGPLEELVSHSGNGLRALDEVIRAAWQNTAFRAALRNVWLSPDLPQPVGERLGALGARRIR